MPGSVLTAEGVVLAVGTRARKMSSNNELLLVPTSESANELTITFKGCNHTALEGRLQYKQEDMEVYGLIKLVRRGDTDREDRGDLEPPIGGCGQVTVHSEHLL